MLTIRHLNGAQAGTEVKLDQAKDRVVVGRQLDCDVQYPPEETAVARHHFALVRKPSGSWTVELFGTPFVAINGTPADNGQVVRDGAKVELGRVGGPAFNLGITEDTRADNYLRTVGQAEAASPRAIATQASTMARVARAIAAVAVVVALGGGAFAAYNYISTNQTATRLDAAQKQFAETLAREANLRISADVRAHIARAAYHVELQDAQQRVRAAGTAWPVRPNLLATNAHVGILREGLRPRERMIVRAPGANGQIYEVVEHKLHPGYVPFNAFLQSDLRLISEYRGGIDSLSGNGYDVSLLRVTGTLPEADRLEIATAEEMNALAAGTPLATSGYPSENLTNSWAQGGLGATPEQHLGVVTAVTDMFHLPAPIPLRQLIHHDLPATGGASGSPIVGASGRVVALLNAGNLFMVEGRRVPNAVLINFGQRADLVRDMLDGTADQKLADARAHWTSIAENFASAKDIVPDNIVRGARPDDNSAPRMIAEIKRKMKANSGKRVTVKNDRVDTDMFLNYSEIPLKLSPSADYLFLVVAEGRQAEIDLYVDGKIAATAKAGAYPFIGCRLLTAAQQNTGDPAKPRAGCAIEAQRLEGMRISDPSANPRDVELIVYNNRSVTDMLASADLEYTIRVYQWVPARQSSLQ
jgi:hypothetical protein